MCGIILMMLRQVMVPTRSSIDLARSQRVIRLLLEQGINEAFNPIETVS